MHFMLETLVPKDKAGLDRSSDTALLVSEVSKQLIKKKTFFSCQRKTCFFMLQWSGSTRTLTKSVSFVFQTTVFNRAQYHSQYGLSASFHQMKPNAVEPVAPLE